MAAFCDLSTNLCLAATGTSGMPESEPPMRIPFPRPVAEPAPLEVAPDAGPPPNAGPLPDAHPLPPDAAEPVGTPTTRDAAPAQASCTSLDNPVERLWGDIFSRRRLTCDRDYL
jgi:hypothetical protein